VVRAVFGIAADSKLVCGLGLDKIATMTLGLIQRRDDLLAVYADQFDAWNFKELEFTTTLRSSHDDDCFCSSVNDSSVFSILLL
jgi:hypothetical protein